MLYSRTKITTFDWKDTLLSKELKRGVFGNEGVSVHFCLLATVKYKTGRVETGEIHDLSLMYPWNLNVIM